jgi:hypothetical protein
MQRPCSIASDIDVTLGGHVSGIPMPSGSSGFTVLVYRCAASVSAFFAPVPNSFVSLSLMSNDT